MIENIELFNVRLPGNVNAFNAYFASVTSIELIDVESFIKYNMYTPELEPVSLNF